MLLLLRFPHPIHHHSIVTTEYALVIIPGHYIIIIKNLRIMSKYQQTYSQFRVLMGDAKEFSAVEELVVLIHSINRANGLACMDGIEQFEFPVDWRTPKDGTYVFTYRNDRNNATLRVNATPKDNKLEVLFNELNSSLSYRTVLSPTQSADQNAKNYDLNLQEYLKESEKREPKLVDFKRDTSGTRKVDAPTQGAYTSLALGNYPPKDLVNPPSSVNNPFGQEEYVGPNSIIFNQPTNPYQNVPPFPGSLQIPPGARYDPVDPFDDPKKGHPQGPQDFFGFDEFGRPKQSPFGGNNKPGRGGFGGGFGGFGGGFGPNFGV